MNTYLALGTPVVYTQCAAVARKGKKGMYNQGWFIPVNDNGVAPYGAVFPEGVETEQQEPFFKDSFHDEPIRLRFVDGEAQTLAAERLQKLNKAVVVYDWAGSGVVCGLDTKQFGTSHPQYGHDEDYEQGYFDKLGQVKLYVVRSRLEGREFVYVPTWAILPVVHFEAA